MGDEIEKESELKALTIYGYEFSAEMTVLDCKQKEVPLKDGTVDVLVSSDCIMKDKKLGHPDEKFLVEAHRLLREGGWFVVTRRFHGVHLGLELYAYFIVAQQLGWRNVFASRIREVFYVGWQKMKAK